MLTLFSILNGAAPQAPMGCGNEFSSLALATHTYYDFVHGVLQVEFYCFSFHEPVSTYLIISEGEYGI